MSTKTSLAELEQVAKALAIKVTYEDLQTSKGGSCRVMETRRVIINKHLHANEKATILARELGRFLGAERRRGGYQRRPLRLYASGCRALEWRRGT